MRKSVETKRGTVHLIGDMPHEELSSLQMEEGLGVFFHYRYEDAVKTREVLASVCTAPHDRLFCAVREGVLLGYITIVETEEGTRWRRINESLLSSSPLLENPVLLELGSIEISLPWRSMGLARRLMTFVFEDQYFDSKIVFSRELSWHWDLKSSDLDMYRYRTVLMRLFEGAGFRYCETDDDEISYAGENLFMARVGGGVPADSAFLFYRSLCRSQPRGWGWG
jgi:acetoin utilization protein AcuA